MSIENDRNVNHPSHYLKDSGVEVIDAIEAWELGFHLGNTVKYCVRAGKKDPKKTLEDLNKALWYLQRKIERVKKRMESQRTLNEADLHSGES